MPAMELVPRAFWRCRIDAAWRQRSVVWLAGVRRVGKTILCQSLPDVEYFDCELPRTRRLMDDPEGFLDSLRGRRLVLDEIHRLPNSAELLKIAADHHPTTRIVATGSSSLQASERFRDTLAGRKAEVWVTPMNEADRRAYNVSVTSSCGAAASPPADATMPPVVRPAGRRTARPNA